jgi:predicted Zn-dependent peptidase
MNNYDITMYNTDKFKSIEMHVLYRINRNIDDYLLYAIREIFYKYNKIYKSRREMLIQEEELYNEYISFNVYHRGKHTILDANISIINPKLVKDNYLKDAIKYLFDILYNPSFDDSHLKLIKDKLNELYNSAYERPAAVASRNAFQLFIDNELDKTTFLVEKDIVENITMEDIEKKYNELMNDSVVSAYVLGNINKYEDEIINIIDSNIKANNNFLVDYQIDIPYLDEIKTKTDIKKGIKQAQLYMIYNTPNADELGRVKIRLFNTIFGSSGQSSRLFNNVREQKQVCYVIHSSYDPYDNSICVYSGTNADTLDDTIKEVNNTFDSMKNITDEELNNARAYILNSIDSIYDDLTTIYRRLMTEKEYGRSDIETVKKMYMDVTKEDIQELVDKIRLNTLYVLKGDK